MTSAICSSTGMIWLGSAISAVVAMTAVIASSSGIRAATAEPNTSSRITSVSGIAIIPAVFSMLLKAASVAFVGGDAAELVDLEARMLRLRSC